MRTRLAMAVLLLAVATVVYSALEADEYRVKRGGQVVEVTLAYSVEDWEAMCARSGPGPELAPYTDDEMAERIWQAGHRPVIEAGLETDIRAAQENNKPRKPKKGS